MIYVISAFFLLSATNQLYSAARAAPIGDQLTAREQIFLNQRLALAVTAANYQEIRQLVSDRADINATSARQGEGAHRELFGTTPLIRAVSQGNQNMVIELLSLNADVDRTATGSFATPLCYNAHNWNQGGAHLAITKILFEAGADYTVRHQDSGRAHGLLRGAPLIRDVFSAHSMEKSLESGNHPQEAEIFAAHKAWLKARTQNPFFEELKNLFVAEQALVKDCLLELHQDNCLLRDEQRKLKIQKAAVAQSAILSRKRKSPGS